MRADASANRRALLDAARMLLVTEPDASLAAVAEAAGVSRRTVYAHFSSRADLLDQVAADLGRSLAAHMADQPADDDPVRALAHLLFTTNATLTDFHRVGEAALRSGARATLLAETGAVRQRVRGLVEAGLRSGRLRCPLSPAAAVPMLTGLQQGVFEAVIAGDLAPAAAPEALVRLALAALGLDPAEIDALADEGAAR